MPYPLANLSDTLRSRLNDFVTPVERYNLQIAANDVSICPPSIQTIKNVEHLTFKCKHDEVEVFPAKSLLNFQTMEQQTKISLDPDSLYCGHNVTFYNASVNRLKNEIFGHFILRPNTVLLINSKFSSKFITKLSQIIDGNLKTLSVMDVERKNYFLDFKEVLTAFPRLSTVRLAKFCVLKTWMADILQIETHQLRQVLLTLRADQFKPFTCDELLTFLRAQEKGFSLIIYITGAVELVQTLLELKDQLNQQMTHLGNKVMLSEFTHFGLSINLSDANTWYLP